MQMRVRSIFPYLTCVCVIDLTEAQILRQLVWQRTEERRCLDPMAGVTRTNHTEICTLH
jgi:hypothetical protein